MNIPQKIVNKMFDKDAFSQFLGIEIIDVSEGYCKLKMKLRKEMINGFNIANLVISYSLADSALAFASNSHGRKSLSVETSISHMVSIKAGDMLTAMTKELSRSDKIGVYLITITNDENQEIANFKGTVYRTSQNWLSENE